LVPPDVLAPNDAILRFETPFHSVRQQQPATLVFAPFWHDMAVDSLEPMLLSQLASHRSVITHVARAKLLCRFS
jgi:hypothetical protein